MDVMEQTIDKLNGYTQREQFRFFMWWRSSCKGDDDYQRFHRITNSKNLDGFDWSIIYNMLNVYEGEQECI